MNVASLAATIDTIERIGLAARAIARRGERLFSGVQNDDTGFGARVAGYLGAFYRRHAALR